MIKKGFHLVVVQLSHLLHRILLVLNVDKMIFIVEQSAATPWLSLQSSLLLSDRIDEAVKKIFVKQRDH